MTGPRLSFASHARAALVLAALAVFLHVPAFTAEPLSGTPWLHRLEPLGGALGSSPTVTIVGERLSNTDRVVFDSPGLTWKQMAPASWGKLTGTIEISADAPLGPHILHVTGKDGRSNSRLFYVDGFPSISEKEPNDRISSAQQIELKPENIEGGMLELSDVDVYAFDARAGERWTFDLRSIEYGGFLEGNLTLLDAAGSAIAFNDDRDDYLETPFLEHVFDKAGRYYLKLDQYRGPQRVDCYKNCGYMLRISQLPVVEAVFPLGSAPGAETLVSIRGRALDSIDKVYLQAVRGAEHYRLTFPYTMPLRQGEQAEAQSAARIDGVIVSKKEMTAEVSFAIPQDAAPGLWRLWTAGPQGVTDALSFEISPSRELTESAAKQDEWRGEPVVINASLDQDGEQDSYWLQARTGIPLNISTLAVQLGLPSIDTVLELFDENNRLLAEHDDLMSGQGTVVGNPDSSLVFVPDKDQRLRLVVRDRIGRGGASYVYRLKIANRAAGFRLLIDPENVTAPRGGEGDLGVLLIREPGFDGEVEVWAEGLPPGIETEKFRFRADQIFGPSADGDNIIIPEFLLKLRIPEEVAAGDYPVRVFGRAVSSGETIEAYTTLWIGPARKRNDVRRPLPQVTLTVVEPFKARISAVEDSMQLLPGGSATLTIKTTGMDNNAEIRLAEMPGAVSYRVLERHADTVLVELQASESAAAGASEFVVEANNDGRWTASDPVRLSVSPQTKESASR